jgi:hypothetical protein
MICADLQLLLGLLLYFVASPLTKAALAAFGPAMKDPVLRFWAVEHGFAMLAGIALVHVGKVLAGKAEGVAKHARARTFFTAAFIAFVVGNPWPFMAYGRSLLP